MKRLCLGVVVLAGSLLASGWLVGADDNKKDDKKDEPAKVKGFLPQSWGKIGLSEAQKQDIYKIKGKYTTEIDKLKAKIDELKAKEKTELEKILTDDQKKTLRDIRTGDKPKDPTDSKETPKTK